MRGYGDSCEGTCAYVPVVGNETGCQHSFQVEWTPTVRKIRVWWLMTICGQGQERVGRDVSALHQRFETRLGPYDLEIERFEMTTERSEGE